MHTRLNRQAPAIFIVDDHPVSRYGLRELLEREGGFTICGEAGDVGTALETIETTKPDLVLVDLRLLNGESGLDLARALNERQPPLPVLVVSMHDEQIYAESALWAGARGYVMKTSADRAIIHAVREVLAGRTYFSPAVRGQLRERPTPVAGAERASPLDQLSDREREVFHLIGQGYAPRHIAQELGLSVSTIEVYRGRLKEKLGLRNAAELLRYAMRWHEGPESL